MTLLLFYNNPNFSKPILFKAPYKITATEFDKFKLRLFLCIGIFSCVCFSNSNTSAGNPRVSGPKVKYHRN